MNGKIHIAGRPDGPFTVDEVRVMRKRGEVDERTGYRYHENENWRKLGTLGGTKAALFRRILVIVISVVAVVGIVIVFSFSMKKDDDVRPRQNLEELLVMTTGTLLGACMVAGIVGIYLLPTIVAHTSKHYQATAITALNILLGWTFVGWVASLVWALTKPPRDPNAR